MARHRIDMHLSQSERQFGTIKISGVGSLYGPYLWNYTTDFNAVWHFCRGYDGETLCMNYFSIGQVAIEL